MWRSWFRRQLKSYLRHFVSALAGIGLATVALGVFIHIAPEASERLGAAFGLITWPGLAVVFGVLGAISSGMALWADPPASPQTQRELQKRVETLEMELDEMRERPVRKVQNLKPTEPVEQYFRTPD